MDPPDEQELDEEVKGSIAERLEEGIVDHHGLMGEPAADGAVATRRDRIEEITDLGQDLHEITVHGQDIAAGSRGAAVPQGEPDAVGRLPVDQPDGRIRARDLSRHLGRPVGAVIVDDDDLVDVVAVEL